MVRVPWYLVKEPAIHPSFKNSPVAFIGDSSLKALAEDEATESTVIQND